MKPCSLHLPSLIGPAVGWVVGRRGPRKRDGVCLGAALLLEIGDGPNEVVRVEGQQHHPLIRGIRSPQLQTLCLRRGPDGTWAEGQRRVPRAQWTVMDGPRRFRWMGSHVGRCASGFGRRKGCEGMPSPLKRRGSGGGRRQGPGPAMSTCQTANPVPRVHQKAIQAANPLPSRCHVPQCVKVRRSVRGQGGEGGGIQACRGREHPSEPPLVLPHQATPGVIPPSDHEGRMAGHTHHAAEAVGTHTPSWSPWPGP